VSARVHAPLLRDLHYTTFFRFFQISGYPFGPSSSCLDVEMHRREAVAEDYWKKLFS